MEGICFMLPSNVDDRHEGNAIGEEDLLETRIGSDCAGRLEKLSVIRTLGNVSYRGAGDDLSRIKPLDVLAGWGADIPLLRFSFGIILLCAFAAERGCNYNICSYAGRY